MNGMLIDKSKFHEIFSSIRDFIYENRDLPQMVFRERNLKYWFFERPVLLDYEVVARLIESSASNFGGDVYVKYSLNDVLDSVLIAASNDPVGSAKLIAETHHDFLVGHGYPIVFGDSGGNWLAFESVFEELGVLGLRPSADSVLFESMLNRNMLTRSDLIGYAPGDEIGQKIASAFLREYPK